MKTKQQIQEQLNYAKDQLDDARNKVNGPEGEIYKELIQQMKGEIMALEWVLNGY
jgi:predicted negative regulator of RcsB-dependent stress response